MPRVHPKNAAPVVNRGRSQDSPISVSGSLVKGELGAVSFLFPKDGDICDLVLAIPTPVDKDIQFQLEIKGVQLKVGAALIIKKGATGAELLEQVAVVKGDLLTLTHDWQGETSVPLMLAFNLRSLV